MGETGVHEFDAALELIKDMVPKIEEMVEAGSHLLFSRGLWEKHEPAVASGSWFRAHEED